MSASIRKVKKSKKKMALLTEPPPSPTELVQVQKEKVAITRKTRSIVFAIPLFASTKKTKSSESSSVLLPFLLIL